MCKDCSVNEKPKAFSLLSALKTKSLPKADSSVYAEKCGEILERFFFFFFKCFFFSLRGLGEIGLSPACVCSSPVVWQLSKPLPLNDALLLLSWAVTLFGLKGRGGRGCGWGDVVVFVDAVMTVCLHW